MKELSLLLTYIIILVGISTYAYLNPYAWFCSLPPRWTLRPASGRKNGTTRSSVLLIQQLAKWEAWVQEDGSCVHAISMIKCNLLFGLNALYDPEPPQAAGADKKRDGSCPLNGHQVSRQGCDVWIIILDKTDGRTCARVCFYCASP